MGVASAELEVSLYSTDRNRAIETLLCLLPEKFIQPRFLEMHVPGPRAKVHAFKSPASLGAVNPWLLQMRFPMLQTEQISQSGDFTHLEALELGFSLPRDTQLFFDQLSKLYEAAIQLRDSGQQRDACVWWSLWGVTKTFHVVPTGSLEAAWVFRERNRQCDFWEPLVRLVSWLCAEDEALVFTFFTRAHAWSLFEDKIDSLRDEWIKKEDLRAASENARLVADFVRAWLSNLSGGEYTWILARGDHTPDLTGFLSEELERALGPQAVRRSISSLESPR